MRGLGWRRYEGRGDEGYVEIKGFVGRISMGRGGGGLRASGSSCCASSVGGVWRVGRLKTLSSLRSALLGLASVSSACGRSSTRNSLLTVFSGGSLL